MSGKRALSPILSTMILLMAALLAGILIYNYFNRTLQGMMNTPNPIIESATYYPDVEILMTKIKNLGGAPIPLNNTKILIIGKTCTCTCSIVCSSPASLSANNEISITIYSNATGTTSISSCSVYCTNTTFTSCLEELSVGNARIGFQYSYAGSTYTTRLEQVMLG